MLAVVFLFAHAPPERYDDAMSFESTQSYTKLESEAQLHNPEYVHPIVAQAAIEARKLKKKDAIDPNEFKDLYGELSVVHDLDMIQKLKKSPDFIQNSAAHAWADVFEAVFYQHVEQSNWLGEEVHTILPSEFDDFINKIDVMARADSSPSALPFVGVGVDVTFGTTKIAQKITGIFNEIEKGRLGTMRYFVDPEVDDYKGPITKVPHLVVGVERVHIIELARQWMNGENKALAQNPIQLVILKQIMEQLKAYRGHAKKMGQSEIAAIYSADIDAFEPVLQERRKMDIRNYENDHIRMALSHEIFVRK